MPKQEKMLAKKRGRPATGRGRTIGVRIHNGDLAKLDKYRARLDGKPTRPEVIRRIIADFLK
jgi:hypothetical protein